MRNAGLEEAQTEIKIAQGNINNLRYTDDTTLMAESEEELKILLMRWKRRVKKLAGNSTFKKIKIMASSPTTSWQIEGEKVQAVTDFIFLDSKITADGDCSHEIKILAPWKESYDKSRQCIKKKCITLLTKVHIVKAMVFPVIMYGCESWTIKKAEC